MRVELKRGSTCTSLDDYDSIIAVFSFKNKRLLTSERNDRCLQPAIKNHQSPADKHNPILDCSERIQYFHVSFHHPHFNLITLNNRKMVELGWMDECEAVQNNRELH